MKTRDFFRICIKILSLYVLIQIVFGVLPTLITAVPVFGTVLGVLYYAAIILILGGICMGIIKYADKIIDTFRLDQGFDEDRISFGQLDEVKMFSLASILVGAMLVADYFPTLIYQVFLAIKGAASSGSLGSSDFYNYNSVSYHDLGFAVLSMIVGYLLMVNNRAVAAFLSGKSGGEVE